MKSSQKKITFEDSSENNDETKEDIVQDELKSKKRKRSESDNKSSKSKKISKKRDDDEATVKVIDVKSLININDEDGDETAILETAKYPLTNYRLSPVTIKKLNEKGIKSLFEIQAHTFDHIYDGKDVIGRARTGMGKTLAFVLPVIEQLKLQPEERNKVRVIVMAPVRELAKQIAEEFESVTDLKVGCFYGGVPIGEHISTIRRGFDILVGTPGRINDLLNRNVLKLENVKFVILDEADKMLEMGFKDEMEIILSSMGPNVQNGKKIRQMILFSATVPDWVKKISDTYMTKDKVVADMVENQDQKASIDVRHIAVPCHYTSRSLTVLDLISMYAGASGRTIVFCETKKDCNDFVGSEEFTLDCGVIHGDVPQNQREIMLQSFRDGKTKVLIATDVAARGLDMIVDLVIQTKPPVRASGACDVDTYVHRSGRTGRAGRKGICVTLYTPAQKQDLKVIERSVGNKFEWIGVPKPEDVIKVSSDNVLELANDVDKDVLPYFKDATKKFLAKYDKSDAIAILLSLVTGYLKPPRPRSMLANVADYITLQYTTAAVIPGTGFVFNALRNHLSNSTVENLTRMCLSDDGRTAVFDVPVSSFEEFKTVIYEGSPFQICDILPNLRERAGSNNSGGGSRGGSRGGYGGGYGGGRSRSDGGGRGRSDGGGRFGGQRSGNGNGYGRSNGNGYGRSNGYGNNGNDSYSNGGNANGGGTDKRGFSLNENGFISKSKSIKF